MRYTILGFNQEIACKLRLNCKELVFLRWFIDFMATLKMKYTIKDGKTYFWIDSETVIEELPILEIKHTKNLRRFLKGLVEKGILDYYLFQSNTPFYRINHEKVYLLISRPPKARKVGGHSQWSGGGTPK